jgi:hypothetical protein
MIESRSSMIALLSRIILSSAIVIFILPGLSEGPWILIVLVVLGIYVITSDILKLLMNIYRSPEWLKLSDGSLIVKPRYKDSFSIPVSEATRIAEAKWIKLIASYDRKIVCAGRKLTLYLGRAEFVGLNEFLAELKKANPACEVDEYLTL